MIRKIEKILKLDDFALEAIYTPAMVNIIYLAFIITCVFFDLGVSVNDFVWWKVALDVLGAFSVAVVFTRFVMEIFRGTSKLFENINYGKDRLHFPTTSMLLHNDKSISQDLKKRVREKLKSIYNINLLSKTKEEADEMEARRTAKDAVASIRQIMSDSKDVMTDRKLRRYDAYRNFLGGALCCFIVSVILLIVDYNKTGVCNMVLVSALLLYIIIIVVDYLLTKSAAVDYAETLITTFDKIENDEA